MYILVIRKCTSPPRRGSNPGPAESEADFRSLPLCLISVSSIIIRWCCNWVLRRSLTSQVIIVAFYIEHEKSNKFCSEALILAWGSFICHKATQQNQRLYFPSNETHTQDFYALKNPSIPAGFQPTNFGSSGKYDNHGTTRVDSML